MKLLLFIHSLSSGGAERNCSNLANYWADKAWNITIVTITGCKQDFYPLHPDIQRITLCLDADSTSLFSAINSNYQRIKSLRKTLLQLQPDIALAFMSTANILLALAARRLNIPAIGSERTHPPMLPLGKMWEWQRRHCYRSLDAVTALTEDSAIWLLKYTNAQFVPIIPNAINYPIVTNSCIVSQVMETDNSFNLIAVGRLSPEKGFDRLMLAFSKLAPRFPDWNLTILGEGPCQDALEKQRKELSLEQRVLLPGTVMNIGKWYQAADLFVLSSLFEGFPNALVEAMAYGLPVVSVDCDTGPRDIIHHKVDGLLVPQNNHEALVEALNTLMNDKTLRQHYAGRATEIRERLSMQKIAGMWEQLFIEIINNRD